MRARLTGAVMGALMLVGGCGMAPSDADGQGGAGFAAAGGDAAGEAVAHDDARFLVRRGDEVYRADVRYVDVLDNSVIAVRRGRGEADESWPGLEIPAASDPPATLPFGAEAWRTVAVDVGEAVREQADVCPTGKEMQLFREHDGSARTMYRQGRQAWIVLAACREPRQGRGGAHVPLG